MINAAVTGRVDHLEGLKENVIIGRLIPAGTGYSVYKNGTTEDTDTQELEPQTEMDKEIDEEVKKLAPEVIAEDNTDE